jgi:hypothetical protein
VNISRHDPNWSSWAPIWGATIGPVPVIIISIEKKRAAVGPESRSRTTAREMTTPAAPPSPCTSRRAISCQTDVASAQAMEAAMKATIPTSRGGRLPQRSLADPASSCPTASPIRHEVRDSCTWDASASSAALMLGSAGR